MFFKGVRKEEETRRKRKEESKGRQEKEKDFVSNFFPNCKNSPGGRTYLKGLRNVDFSAPGGVVKTRDRESVLSNCLNVNNLENHKETKVKTSTSDY